nr:hypothetical protein [uncultured Schaedlerella sp.]
MRTETIKKQEVEELLKHRIADEQFPEVLGYAEHKQAYIYRQTKNPVVLQHWYLVKLTEEYVRNIAFSKFTMDLCEALRNMEKEHSVKDQSAQTDTPIVTGSAL